MSIKITLDGEDITEEVKLIGEPTPFYEPKFGDVWSVTYRNPGSPTTAMVVRRDDLGSYLISLKDDDIVPARRWEPGTINEIDDLGMEEGDERLA